MRLALTLVVVLVVALVIVSCGQRTDVESAIKTPEWESIFDGKTLAGWSAPDLRYFRVADQAITGETTKELNPERNQFIVWQGGELCDFEVEFEFRIFGTASNSGMQFRSVVKEHGLVHGYQADIDGKAKFFGGIWDEYGTRKSLAGRGQSVVIAEDGKRIVTVLAGSEQLVGMPLDQWTTYRIKCVGPRCELFINQIPTAILVDYETGKARSCGVLAMPIIPGEPMKVQYRHIRIKRLTVTP
jgi:hypothetical protein